MDKIFIIFELFSLKYLHMKIYVTYPYIKIYKNVYERKENKKNTLEIFSQGMIYLSGVDSTPFIINLTRLS